MKEAHGAGIIRIGISSCLLGEQVRFDGGHKRDSFLTETLGPFVEWVPVCPEVELGLGVPRDTLRLVRSGQGVRLVVQRTGADISPAMRVFARERVRMLAGEDLDGYVLKKDSPSCGMERVKVYDSSAQPARSGRGLFAEELLQRFPNLPVEEEGRLCDARLRENFIERIFSYRRLKSLFAAGWRMRDLIRFHAEHKFCLLAHSPKAYAELGRLVGEGARIGRANLRARYESGFMQALAVLATAGRHANVLMHLAGFLKNSLDAASRAELLMLIEDHRRGHVPLVVPLTLLRHHIRQAGNDYLAGQVYLDPHPKELMLRNHV